MKKKNIMEEETNEISPPPLLPIYSLSKVQTFLSSNQFYQAQEFFTNQIKSNPDNKIIIVESLINRSLAYLSLQMTKNALEDATKAIEHDQYASPAYFIIGLSYLWNGNEENAISHWRIGLDQTKEFSFYTIMTALINSLNFRAQLFKMRFNVNQVLDLIDDFANPRFPTESDIQDAFTELRNSSYESAIEHFSMIINVNPQNHYAYKGRGVAYCMTGEYNKSIMDLTTAIEKTPNNFQLDTVKVRAIAYAATGNITSALFDLNKYLVIVPEDNEVKIEVAKLHMKRKTYLAAHKLFITIPESEFMKNEDSLLAFAECLYAVGELDNALLILSRVKKIRNHKYHYLSYLINRDLNDIEKAEDEIIEAVRLVPTFFLNRTAADFFCDIGEVEKSIEYYKEALQQCPYDAETHLFYAYALFEIGKLGESALMLQELTVQNEKFKFRGSLEHFDKMNYGINLLQIAQTDFCFIQTAIMSIETSIMNLQHGFFSSSVNGLNQIFPAFASNATFNKNLSQNSVPSEKVVDSQPEPTNNGNKTDKMSSNIQKIEALKNRLSKFYINSLNSNDNGNNNDNDNNNNKSETEVCCDENDLKNQKLEQKIEQEMFNYLFGKEYSNEIDKDEMNFNECLDQVIALNGKGNISQPDFPADLTSYLEKNKETQAEEFDSNSNANDSYLNNDHKIDNNLNHERNTLFFKQINNDFKLKPLNMTPEIVKMIEDADRLGSRCIPIVKERTVNKRLTRALGFCVLRLAYMMRTQWFKATNNNYSAVFDEIIAILQFADMRNNLKFNYNESDSSTQKAKMKSKHLTSTKTSSSSSTANNSTSSNFSQFCCPTYYVMKNGRMSARFGFIVNKVFQIVRENFQLAKIDSFEDVYQTFQVDFLNKPQLEVNDLIIDLPYIILKYNGIYGFDLFIRPLSDSKSWKKYDYQLHVAFCELMKRGEDSTINLAFFIILIWLRHPLNYYSPEIGHLFLHAFVLASNGAEIAAIDETNGENFIQHMVLPSIEEFSNLLYEHALNNKLESKYSEESLTFWSSMPSISTMIQLMNVKNE